MARYRNPRDRGGLKIKRLNRVAIPEPSNEDRRKHAMPDPDGARTRQSEAASSKGKNDGKTRKNRTRSARKRAAIRDSRD